MKGFGASQGSRGKPAPTLPFRFFVLTDIPSMLDRVDIGMSIRANAEREGREGRGVNAGRVCAGRA